MKKFCYFGGAIIPLSRAGLPPDDLAVLRGYAVFDFLKTVNGGRPFLWREHWRRFVNSAKTLDLRSPVGESAARKIVAQLLKKNGSGDWGIRLVLTGDRHFFILIEDSHILPPRLFKRGAKVILAEHERLLPIAKTTNYITALRLEKAKKRAGATEILYQSDGKILECATSNFFLVKDGALITTKENILLGVTRNLVIKLAGKAGITVDEREVKVGELKTADECFLTATNKDVLPVVQIDNLKINNGQVGPITRRLQKLFNEFVAKY